MPFVALPISPAQLIAKTIEKPDQSLWTLFQFLVPSTGLLTLALVGCLLYWVISSLLGRFQKSSPRKNLQTQIVAFFVLFLFHIKEFFVNNLNTSNVIVRTDELLYSREQILKTKKEFCFWEKGGNEEEFIKKVSCLPKCLLGIIIGYQINKTTNFLSFPLFRRPLTRYFKKSTRREIRRTPATNYQTIKLATLCKETLAKPLRWPHMFG